MLFSQKSGSSICWHLTPVLFRYSHTAVTFLFLSQIHRLCLLLGAVTLVSLASLFTSFCCVKLLLSVWWVGVSLSFWSLTYLSCLPYTFTVVLYAVSLRVEGRLKKGLKMLFFFFSRGFLPYSNFWFWVLINIFINHIIIEITILCVFKCLVKEDFRFEEVSDFPS